jgi:hypothetical protein
VQASQIPVPTLHAGVSPEQSVSVVHPTTQAPEGSQTPKSGSIAPHCESALQATQSPSTASHTGLVPPQSPADVHLVGTSTESMGTSAGLDGRPAKQAQSLSIPEALADEPSHIFKEPLAPLSFNS